MDHIEIIGAHEDGMVFERAFVADSNGRPAARAIISGVECNIETRTGPLEENIAFCQPVDGKLADNWPIYLDVRRDGGAQERWRNVTINPSIVMAARRFNRLIREGRALAGQAL